jgi:uncharacterized protein involved in tellurium resistance
MEYLKEIIINIEKIDENFTKTKQFGKIIVEINYQNGKYVCDSVKEERTNKRIVK